MHNVNFYKAAQIFGVLQFIQLKIQISGNICPRLLETEKSFKGGYLPKAAQIFGVLQFIQLEISSNICPRLLETEKSFKGELLESITSRDNPLTY